MNAADNGTGTIACPRCQTANTSVARFCLTCGSPLQAGVQPPAPPPVPPQPPPMPQYSSTPAFPPAPPSFSPSGLISGGGGPAQITLNMDAMSAFNSALQAVQLVGGSVQAHQAPSIIRFQIGKRSFWGSAMLRMKFDGDVTLSPIGPRQTSMRVSMKLNSGSSTMLLAMDGIALLFLLAGAIMAKNFMLFAFVGAIAGVQYWTISSRWASDLAQGIVNSLMTGQLVPAIAPSPATATRNTLQPPAAAPSPPPIPAGASARVSPPGTVFEQLAQLGALRDSGVVTAEEFESKKAELLKRL